MAEPRADEEGELAESSWKLKLSEKMIDHVLDELEWHERQLSDPNGIQASCFDKIFHSDTLVPATLRDSLGTEVANLEANPPFGEPDWHPGSKGQVLDLVHPSLFPFRYGITPYSPLSAERTKEEEPAEGGRPDFKTMTQEEILAWHYSIRYVRAAHTRSEDYQWLPSDVAVDENGQASFSSYINNLHPERHKSFYLILSSLLTRFLPLFERVLTSLQRPARRRIPVDQQISSEWWEGEQWERDEDGYETRAGFRMPDPELFSMEKKLEEAKAEEAKGPAVPFNGRTLQVITKIASIHLTPENPQYEGGVWHVEGMQNEEIVVSGIYYFDQDNITESQLAFRGTFDEDGLPYQQNDTDGTQNAWGIVDEGPLMQYYNSLTTSNGRAICFPNIYQHRVSPFSLADPSKPGYRKILVFFLIDPLKTDAGEVISTAQVPYQQQAWVWDEVVAAVEEQESPASRFPREIWEQIFAEMDWLMTYEDAKVVRKELMDERKYLQKENTRGVFERLFSLCEH